MITAGLFVGTMIHNLVLAAPWEARLRYCAGASAGPFDATAFTQCMASVELRRVLISVLAAALVLVAAAVVVIIRPRLHERRHKLRPMGPIYRHQQQLFAQMAFDAGLKQAPKLMRGKRVNSINDPYAYGIPSRYRVTVPPKLLAMADNQASAALLRHEIAHIANRDVTIAWLTRSTLYILGPMLLVPLVAAVITEQFSTIPDYLAGASPGWHRGAHPVIAAPRARIRRRPRGDAQRCQSRQPHHRSHAAQEPAYHHAQPPSSAPSERRRTTAGHLRALSCRTLRLC